MGFETMQPNSGSASFGALTSGGATFNSATFGGFGDYKTEQTQFDLTTPADITCPRCSQRLSDLNETYFVGCSECYKVFAPYVRDLATKYHGRCVHTGKIYERKRNRASIEKEMAELAHEEKQAVLEKNYLHADEVHRKLLALMEVLDGSC